MRFAKYAAGLAVMLGMATSVVSGAALANEQSAPHVELMARAAEVTLLQERDLAQLQGQITSALQKLLSDVEKAVTQAVTCSACIGLLALLKQLALLGPDVFESTISGICLAAAGTRFTPAECQAAGRTSGSALFYMVNNINPLGPQGQEFCFGVPIAFGVSGPLCPVAAYPSYNVPFPKPKPAKVKIPARSGKTIDVLHLSDWHVDFEYKVGSEANCNQPLCCRGFNLTKTTASRPAGEWGDYNCDAPRKLAENLLDSVTPVSGKPAFAIFTGDIDPHNVLTDDRNTSTFDITSSYKILHAKLDAQKIKLYPSIGNHEAGPVNQFPYLSEENPPSNQWLYNLLADSWKGWLPSSALNTVRTNGHGSYSVRPAAHPKLRIISLNTNLAYHANFYLYPRFPTEKDPDGVLAWTVKELQAAEDNGERVWIIMHVPTNNIDAIPSFGSYFAQIIQRYNETIAGTFAGHTHRDEFAITYTKNLPGSDPSLDPSNAVSVNYIGPSVTPYTELNPGWRTYSVDSGSYDIMDSRTYIANLDQAPNWGAKGPNWHLEYSARAAYGPWPATTPLTPAFWSQAAQRIRSDPALWSKYFEYRGKSSGRDGNCPYGSACQKDVSNDLNVGASNFYVNPASARKRDLMARREAHEQGRNVITGQHYRKPLCAALH